jgi:hypothetical protein
MGYLVGSNLSNLNQGNKPTSEVCKVTDLTLGPNKIGNLVSNWHVSDEPSLSDHSFQTGNTATTIVTFRDHKRTNWESYKDHLRLNPETTSQSICMIRDKDLAVDQLHQAIMSYHNNCPAKITHSPRIAPWWNKKLSGLRAKRSRLLNIAKRQASGRPERKLSPVTTKKLGKPNNLHGEGPTSRSPMYEAVPDS